MNSLSIDQQLYKDILDQIHEGVYFLDKSRTISYWNKAMENLTEYASDEMVGQTCDALHLNCVNENGSELCKGICMNKKVMLHGIPVSEDVYFQHKKGHRVPVRITSIPIKEKTGELAGVAAVCADNTEKILWTSRIEELKREALIDPLTGLGNRRYAEQVIISHLNELARYNHAFGIIFMDIDKFKNINDQHGHAAGDEVLKMVSRTLQENSRSSDLVARWGGEEIIAVSVNVSPEQLVAIANKYVMLIRNSLVRYLDKHIKITISAGATMSRPADNEESIIKRADMLMYQSKTAGRNLVSSDY